MNMTTQTTKLTISLPQNLLSLADKMAKDKKLTRSKLVALCLQKMAEENLRAEMEEGYKAMAEENRETAKLTFKRQSEIVPDW
jgi:metal-responsive CopG/Arc/MetJ family transcriptional regulator